MSEKRYSTIFLSGRWQLQRNKSFFQLKDVKKEYNMSEADFRDFKQKVREDEEDQERKGEKFEKKLERRAQKKELKKSVQDSCKTQW